MGGVASMCTRIQPAGDSARPRSVTWRCVVWWAGLAALLGAAGAAYCAGWDRIPTFLVGDVVVGPAVWVYVPLGVGLCCWTAVGILRLSAAPPAGKPQPPRRVAGAVVGLVTLAGLTCTVPLAVFTAFAATDHHYRILSPASPGGCRLVTAKAPSYGPTWRAYISDPGSIVLQRTNATWGWDGMGGPDPYVTDPIDSGHWSLHWDGDHGILNIVPTPTVALAETLTCPHG